MGGGGAHMAKCVYHQNDFEAVTVCQCKRVTYWGPFACYCTLIFTFFFLLKIAS